MEQFIQMFLLFVLPLTPLGRNATHLGRYSELRLCGLYDEIDVTVISTRIRNKIDATKRQERRGRERASERRRNKIRPGAL
jgi:hypothetical protein